MTRNQTLRGRRILVVEDEAAIAHFIRETLEGAGATIVGVAGDCFEARRILDGTGVEVAIVDLHLGGGSGHSLGHLLSMRKIPFLFATGYAVEASRDQPGSMVLQKPFDATDLVAAVVGLLNGRTGAQRTAAHAQ